MPRSIAKSKVEDFEPRKKNPLGLLDDSNLDEHLKSLKIGDKTTPLQLSESEFRIDADLFIGGQLTSHKLSTENQYFDIEMATDGSFGYVRFISGGLNPTRDPYTMYLGAFGDVYHVAADAMTWITDTDFTWSTSDSGVITSTAKLQAGGSFTLYDGDDTGDYFNINVSTAGATTLTTFDNDGTAAHLTLAPDGDLILDPVSTKVIINATDDLFFDGGSDTYITESSIDNLRFYVGGDLICSMAENGSSGNQINISGASAGFSQIEPTFDATDTDVDFRKSNKQKLTLTDNCADIHFQFPAMSGNFICVLLQDGTGGRTISNWKTKDLAGNAGAGNSGLVLWAGGTAPLNTETADKSDIVSIYWDNDNEIAYGTYTYNF